MQKMSSTALIKVGDFYEIFGRNAIKIADEFALTLTTRELGLERRVPMIGFPYHSANKYFKKIIQKYRLIIADHNRVFEFKSTPSTEKRRDISSGTKEVSFVQNNDIVENIPVKDFECGKIQNAVISKLRKLVGNNLEVR